MITRTFFTPDARFRLIVTRNGNAWSAEIRSKAGSLFKAGEDVDQVTGEVFMLASQRYGMNLCELFGQADDAINDGYFAEVLV